MITREQLEAHFDHTRAVAKWSIDDVCLWGYFFTDHDRSKLSAAAPVLEQMGYRFVGFLEPTSDDDDQELLFLHVEREERHTVDSLHARNQELYRFAEEHGIETYDGMDVGPVRPESPNHALQRTAPRVTVAATSSLDPSSPSHLWP